MFTIKDNILYMNNKPLSEESIKFTLFKNKNFDPKVAEWLQNNGYNFEELLKFSNITFDIYNIYFNNKIPNNLKSTTFSKFLINSLYNQNYTEKEWDIIIDLILKSSFKEMINYGVLIETKNIGIETIKKIKKEIFKNPYFFVDGKLKVDYSSKKVELYPSILYSKYLIKKGVTIDELINKGIITEEFWKSDSALKALGDTMLKINMNTLSDNIKYIPIDNKYLPNLFKIFYIEEAYEQIANNKKIFKYLIKKGLLPKTNNKKIIFLEKVFKE